LKALRAVTREFTFAPGQQIFQEGDPGEGIYVVKTGLVQISAVLENGERHVFAQVVPGEVFGEMAALDNESRSASASAERERRLSILSLGTQSSICSNDFRSFP